MDIDTEEKNVNSFSFWRRMILIFIFFTLTPLSLLASVISLVAISKVETPQVLGESTNIFEIPEKGVQVYASLPNELPSISGEIVSADARPEIIRSYLSAYDSPMLPHADYLVKKSDEYGLDWKLLTAIGMKESGLGKAMPSDDCHNAWGYGIHSAGTLCFDSWEEGIDYVADGLKRNYIDMGYITTEEIMTKYAHPDSTTWAEGVNIYLERIENF